MLNGLLAVDFVEDLIFALIHTLWQGTLIAAVLYLYLKIRGGVGHGRRYVLCVSAMVALDRVRQTKAGI
jgi:hypothetical protein